jgi:hypothetical protein
MALGEIVFGGSWLLILTVLVLDLVGILHRGTGFRWQAAGLLVMNTALDVSVFVHLHSRVIFPMMLIGFAIFGVGTVIYFKDQRTGQPASKS